MNRPENSLPADEGQRLISDGRAAPHHVEIARREQEVYRKSLNLQLSLAEILRRNGFLRGEEGVTFARSTTATAASGPQLRSLVAPDLCRTLDIYLVSLANGVLTVATLNDLTATNRQRLLDACKLAGFEVSEILTDTWDRGRLMTTLRDTVQLSADHISAIVQRSNVDPKNSDSITNLTSAIVTEALQLRASDIHIDVHDEDPTQCRVLYRVDGALVFRHLVRPEALRAVSARIKYQAGMESNDKQKPQDGRHRFNWHGRSIDIRIASAPTDDGETVCLRLLDPAALLTIDELFEHHPRALQRLYQFARVQGKIDGILIFGGATGSGKSTTAVGVLSEMDRARRNVMTVENPIEYTMRHIRQMQVTDLPGRSYPELIRHILRQDPDAIFIGEIRDAETAEAAMTAAETGHQLVSTVHSNDAIQTLDRMIGLFTTSYRPIGTPILGNALYGIVNQRLVPRVCPTCSHKTTLQQALDRLTREAIVDRLRLPAFPISPDAAVTEAAAGGCEICHGTGYRGRVLVPEFLFLPRTGRARSQITAHLRDGNPSAILSVPGVDYSPRAETANHLLQNGVIDPVWFIRTVEEAAAPALQEAAE